MPSAVVRKTWTPERHARDLESKRVYREKNRDKIKVYDAGYRAENKARAVEYRQQNADRLRELNRAWSKANPGRARELTRRWLADRPGYMTAYSRIRDACEKRAQPAWADKDCIRSLYALSSIYRSFGFDVEVDHVIPLKGRRVCGLHVPDNLQIIPGPENRAKGNRFPLEVG